MRSSGSGLLSLGLRLLLDGLALSLGLLVLLSEESAEEAGALATRNRARLALSLLCLGIIRR